MPISISRYVNITSGVGAGANVSTRSLGALIITGNTLCPTGTVLNFTSASAVGTYFGTTSEEYIRALFYFGWVSKNITAPSVISFYFWNNNAATGSLIFGYQQTFTLATFTAISNGDFTLTLGGYTGHVTGINLSAAGSLTAVASALQTAIRGISAGGTAWTAATVAYVATPTQGGLPQFTLTSGATGADTVTVVAGTTADVAAPLGWLTGAILSNGSVAQTISANLTALIALTNNFGSYCYTQGLSVSLANITAAANWNLALQPNIQFLFSILVTSANASTWSAALQGIGGCCVTLKSSATSEYPELVPMMILAATNYNARNSVFNYMFNQFNLTPSVTTDAQANIYDPLWINYYGQTMTAGQTLQFYQRGIMMGGTVSTNPTDINVYCNEIWLKDAIGAAIMTLLLSLAQVAANNTGLSQINSVIQPVINQGVNNGTISIGKPLTAAQQLYITNATGSATAWTQVQNTGYWYNAVVSSYVSNSVTQYMVTYTLIYSKDDVIRLVNGTDIMI